MPIDPRPLRLFARVRRSGFDLECPRCGHLHLIRTGTPGSHARSPAGVYDESTSIFRCRRCGQSYLVGLNLWPIGYCGKSARIPKRKGVPPDTVPTLEQSWQLNRLEERRAQILRARMSSYVHPHKKGGYPVRHPVNTAPPCTCLDRWGKGERASIKGRDPGCPRHGDNVVREPPGEDPEDPANSE